MPNYRGDLSSLSAKEMEGNYKMILSAMAMRHDFLDEHKLAYLALVDSLELFEGKIAITSDCKISREHEDILNLHRRRSRGA